MTRRSPATGCWRESREKQLSSTRSVASSIWESALMTSWAFSASPVSRAWVASRTACCTLPHTDCEVAEDGVELVMVRLTHAPDRTGAR